MRSKRQNNPQLEHLLDEYMDMIVTLTHNRLPGATVYLFGSRARKDYSEGADIDIAIDAGKKITIDIISELYNDVEDTDIPVRVDFVDFNRTSPELIEQIEKEGIVWNK